MKREREVDSMSMANISMLLSRDSEYEANYSSFSNNRIFECKTCNRQFSSFQAFGGHRASHKKPRLMADMDGQLLHGSPQKPKSHECSICGLKFAIGQALGGHMRRHRAANLNGNMQNSMTMSSDSGSGNSLDSSPNMMKAGNNRVLDLNLTPSEDWNF